MGTENETTPSGLKKLWPKRKLAKWIEEQLENPKSRSVARAAFLSHYMTLRKWDQAKQKRNRKPRPRKAEEEKPSIYEMARREATNGREV